MRNESSENANCHDFALACPARSASDSHIRAIYDRGNLPLLIAGDLLAEINRADLAESWQTALTLPQVTLDRLTRKAGCRLAEALHQDRDTEDLLDVVADATAFFLLALRHNGMKSLRNLPACSVTWTSETAEDRLVVNHH